MTDQVIFANAFAEPLWVMIDAENGQKISTLIPSRQSQVVACDVTNNKHVRCNIFIQYGDPVRGSVMLTKLYGPLEIASSSNVVIDDQGRVDRSNKDNAWIDSKGTNHQPACH
ncbi:hypothetical protein QR680_003928 [Steinernema hermaphroditum]|uniref:Uncharacterized protein n=1 Tax=Steinernema hermaphroditum TaxID=289476 RepID=A0AA39LSE3_9BILA|nr:hypothetical protein QR680_003928 [Steinernema hermaphroditum]